MREHIERVRSTATRHTIPGARRVNAECQTCGWRQHTSNAQGSAAQHADRNTGHRIVVEIVQYVTYIGR